MTAPISYFGGKGSPRNQNFVLQHIPKGNCFVDVFGGAGNIILNVGKWNVKVYNDKFGRLVNLYRVLQDPAMFAELCHRLEFTLYSRREFALALRFLKEWEASDEIDFKAAEHTLMLAAHGTVVSGNQSMNGIGKTEGEWSTSLHPACNVTKEWNNKFSTDFAHKAMIAGNMGFGGESKNEGQWGTGEKSKYSTVVTAYNTRMTHLQKWHKEVKTWYIENKDWEYILGSGKWDKPGTVFYLDPPYLHDTRTSKSDYAHEMTLEDHARLVDKMLTLQGMAVLSCYWGEVYQPLLDAGYRRYDLETTASSAGITSINKATTRPKRLETVLVCPKANLHSLKPQMI